jgi:metal-responsive CopG/Arc/MetJ family transcriptional regulator
MKTAISLADKLFHEADAAARRLGISRSQLYAKALTEYLARLSGTQITARLNGVYETVEGRPEPGLAALQSRGMPREDHW